MGKALPVKSVPPLKSYLHLHLHLHLHSFSTPLYSEVYYISDLTQRPPSISPHASLEMSALALDSAIILSSGKRMPSLGFGVYQARGSECESAVTEAIKAGYRHGTSFSHPHQFFTTAHTPDPLCIVDSAQSYHNEDSRSPLSASDFWRRLIQPQWSVEQSRPPEFPDRPSSSRPNTCQSIKPRRPPRFSISSVNH